MVVQARAKAEAAKARAAFANKEKELKIETARLQVTLEAMQEEKEMNVAIAEAETQTLEAGLLETECVSQKSAPLPVPLDHQLQRTADYVRDQAHVKPIHQPARSDDKDMSFYELPVATSQDDQLYKAPGGVSPQWLAAPRQQWDSVGHAGHGSQLGSSQPGSFQFQQQYAVSGNPGTQTTTLDLVKCMARLQLVTTGLTVFDDKPENYWAWKSSFQGAIDNLDLSPREELDTLIKWQSSEHARRIKAVNLRDPYRALRMVWERLEETYGSPEAIEHTLFSKLENFPKVTYKDPHKLRELADLLMEVEAAKLDGFLTGLSYLDTSRGVHPIVEKLPFSIQEKWKSVGSKYKFQHNAHFPPFSVFVDFICNEARTQTDPSFNTASFQSTPAKRERPDRYVRTPVAVHKTQVSPGERRGNQQKDIDLAKHCPIHDKPHSLKKCRTFREKSYEDRKQFLKEHSICFRCCSSTNHFAKDCQEEIRCKECESIKHVSALHPGPAPSRSRSDPPASENGGELNEPDDDKVISKCTDVCGDGVSARACSKICLIDVFPKGRHEESKRMYAILDDQSNRSLARSEFFRLFSITGDSQPYTLKTCAGLKQTAG